MRLPHPSARSRGVPPRPAATPSAAVPAGRRKLGWTKFLPLLLFLSFFMGNTLIPPRSLWIMGRWGGLLAVVGLTVLTASVQRLRSWPPVTLFFILAFFSLVIPLPYSSNPPISVAKWGVFFLFLIFCALFFSRIENRAHAHEVLGPLTSFFVVFIWITPPASLYFPQHSFLGHMNGLLTFTDALGGFLALFGIPGIVYRMQTARDRRWLLFYGATLALSFYLVIASGSRTASLSVLLTMGIAFWRWKRFRGRLVLPAKVLLLGLAFLLIPAHSTEIRSFIYKYPTAENLMDSRASYWERTLEGFRERPWTGAGFGVQEELAGSRLRLATSGAREQGSAYLGMLEEVGILGALPILAILLFLLVDNAYLLLRSKDPMKLLFARSIVVGILMGVSENYLLYLGNAASILFFFAVFMKARIDQLDARLRRARRQQMLAFRWQRSGAAGSGQRIVAT